ncbi:MAG: hypothetical protein J6Y62_00550 [Clostridia bacterium]|nr:hypothetical protein [Clostridia bacterium]
MNVKKADLKKALAKVNSFVSKDLISSAPPRVLFRAKDGMVEITSCNGTDFGQFRFKTEDQSDLSFIVELKSLNRAGALRGDPSIEFEKDSPESDKGCMELKNGDTKMVFPAESGDCYPAGDFKVKSEKHLSLPTDEFKKLVSKVSYCRNEKDQRIFVTGMKIKFDGTTLRVDTTDSICAMSNKYVFAEDQGFSFEGLISPKAISMIENLEDGQQVVIGIDEQAFEIESEDTTVYTPLLNANFPDIEQLYDRVVNNSEFSIDKADILESLALFSMSDNKSLVFEGEGDRIVIHQEDGVTEIKDVIPMSDFNGSAFKFCIDFDNIRDAFQNIKEGSTRLHFVFQSELGAIKIFDDENLVGLLQPMRKDA